MQNDLFGYTHITHSDRETQELGAFFGACLEENAVVAFFGDLGSGKTTFIRGLVQARSADSVSSPTFQFLNIYSGSIPIYHFDLYRLPSPQEFFEAGFGEYFEAGGICCLEWAEKIHMELPQKAYRITFSYDTESQRKILIQKGVP